MRVTLFNFIHRLSSHVGTRVPRYTPSTLTEWYNSRIPIHTSRLLHYHQERTSLVLQMMDEAEVVTKMAYVHSSFSNVLFIYKISCREFARVFGVDFFSVISRGSQFKVESFMLRIAKPESFVFLAPSKQDVSAFSI